MKGVSAFIATILLIAFAVTVGTLVATWQTGFVRKQTDIVSKYSEEEMECSYGGIKIIESTIRCSFAGSTDYLNFTIENTGSVNLYNFSAQIYVNNVAYEYSVYQISDNATFNKGYPLKPNSRKSVWINITDNLANADAGWVRISTRCPKIADKVDSVDCTP